MKSLLISLVAVALVGGLVGGGLFAYFSDTETSTGNTFTAGTIDIDLTGDLGAVVHGSVYHDFKPCETGYLEFTITNSGQNPADVWKLIKDVVDDGGILSGPEIVAEDGTAVDNLSEVTLFDLWIENSVPADHVFNEGVDEMLINESQGLTVAYVAGKYMYLGALANGTSMNIVQSFHIVDNGQPQNEYQGDTFSFSEDFFAQQTVGDATPPANQLPELSK
jgi:spore coat-associated protein N